MKDPKANIPPADKRPPAYEDLLLVLDSMDAAVFVADMETHEIVYVNRHLKDLFGEDLAGRKCWQVFHQELTGPCEECPSAEPVDGKGGKSGAMARETYNSRKKQWFAMRNRVVKWPDGRLVRLEIGMNIDHIKKSEEELRMSRAEFERLVEERTRELQSTNLDLERSRRELLEHKSQIERLNVELLEVNAALKVLARNIDRTKNESEQHILHGIRTNVLPLLLRLSEDPDGKARDAYLESLHVYLDSLTAGLENGATIAEQLTHTELKVAVMIRDGKSSQYIADQLCVSLNTVKSHRRNIRRKLHLSQNHNLRFYLQSKNISGFNGALPNGDR